MLAIITVKVINYKLRKSIHNINFTILWYQFPDKIWYIKYNAFLNVICLPLS